MTVITPRRALIGAATAGIVLASQPALITSPALILPPSISEALERRGVVEPHRRAPDIENVLAMLMMAKAMPGVAAQGGGGPAALTPADVFATSLYTGTGATQTITTGLNMSGEGGLVWVKSRSNALSHGLFDTMRGANNLLSSNATTGNQTTPTDQLTAFTSTGFTLGADTTNALVNFSPYTYVAWSFRRAPKFFDVVTYTGNGSSNRAIAHALGVTPGMVVIKRLNSPTPWPVWHRSGTQTYTYSARLNEISQYGDQGDDLWGSSGVAMNATTFGVGAHADVNGSGSTYVAYLFAHDTAADGVVQCGSYTTDGGGNASIALGWSPQFMLVRNVDGGVWYMFNVNVGNDPFFFAHTSSAELLGSNLAEPTGAGVDVSNMSAGTFVYLAIRAAA